jgi:hypothetical protein
MDDVKSGCVMDDNTIFVDVSPCTHEPLFTTHRDVEVRFEDVDKYLRQLNERNAYGHNDWRLGHKQEIDILLAHQKEGALKDTFNYNRWTIDGFLGEQFAPHRMSSEDLTSDNRGLWVEGDHGCRIIVDEFRALVTVRPVRSGPL